MRKRVCEREIEGRREILNDDRVTNEAPLALLLFFLGTLTFTRMTFVRKKLRLS